MGPVAERVPAAERLPGPDGRTPRTAVPAALDARLADRLSPPEPTAEERAEQALAELKQQYVAGEISEEEFERKIDRLVANDSLDEAEAARERERLHDE